MVASRLLVATALVLTVFLTSQAFAARWGSRVIRFVPRKPIARVKKMPVKKIEFKKEREADREAAVEVKEVNREEAKEFLASLESVLSIPIAPQKTNLPAGLLGVRLSVKSPVAQQVLMSSGDNVLGVFTFTETIGGAVKISELTFLDDISSKNAMTSWIFPSFTNLTLWRGNKKIAGPVNLINNDGNSYKAVFSLTDSVAVGPKEAIDLTLKGDVLSDVSPQFTDNSTHIFKALFGAYIAVAQPITVLRTKLTVNSSVLGTAVKRLRNANDEAASVKFNADKGYDIRVNKMILTFGGDVLTEGQTLKAELNDFYTNANIAHSQCVVDANKSCPMLFLLGISISNNSNIVMKLKFNSESFANDPNKGDSLSVVIKDAIDVDWNNGVSLEESAIPVTIIKVSYE